MSGTFTRAGIATIVAALVTTACTCKHEVTATGAGKALETPVGSEASLWLMDFEAAKKLAAEKNVPVLADFSGSDWCGWCIRLDKEVFSQPAFKSFAKDNLVLFLADFPRRKQLPEAERKQNEALAQRYGIRGLPTVLLLDADGQILARTGYQRGGAEAYVAHLKEVIGEGKDESTGEEAGS